MCSTEPRASSFNFTRRWREWQGWKASACWCQTWAVPHCILRLWRTDLNSSGFDSDLDGFWICKEIASASVYCSEQIMTAKYPEKRANIENICESKLCGICKPQWMSISLISIVCVTGLLLHIPAAYLSKSTCQTKKTSPPPINSEQMF